MDRRRRKEKKEKIRVESTQSMGSFRLACRQSDDRKKQRKVARKRNEDRSEKKVSHRYNGVCGSMLPWEATVFEETFGHRPNGDFGRNSLVSSQKTRQVWVYILSQKRKKLNQKAKRLVLVRYAEGRKVYRLPFSRYVKFDETSVVGNSMMKTDDRPPSEKELLAAEAIVPDNNVISAVLKAFAMQTPRISPRLTKGITPQKNIPVRWKP